MGAARAVVLAVLMGGVMTEFGERDLKPIEMHCRHRPSEKWARILSTIDGRQPNYIIVYCDRCQRGEIIELRRNEGLE